MSSLRSTPLSLDRRTVLGALASGAAAAALPEMARAAPAAAQVYAVPANHWVVTTKAQAWSVSKTAQTFTPKTSGGDADVDLQATRRFQTIEGFGACFNEMGWDALDQLPPADREAVFLELFGDQGAGFSLCRMPIGANDFSRDWYSYDETPGDFALKDFSIARDETSLLPFIKSAQSVRPDLRLWASPWSPPVWMKTNGHYASVSNRPGWPENGLKPGQEGAEGADMFVQDERYFDAYARYFGKFIDAYAKRGVNIGMVMPQNEFNSAQVFPSCCWTPAGLARFLPHLGREMEKRGVEIFFGTMERPDAKLFDAVYQNPAAASLIRGIGFQWAGKGALPIFGHDYPALRLYQTEQECGDGKNDWRYARYAWSLMRYYLNGGCSAYQYWNIALVDGGISRWGWAQNSLVSIDAKTRQYRWNPEYYLLKHVAGLVRPGAQRIAAVSWTGYEDVLAFRNVDGSIAVVAHNPHTDPLPIRFGLGDALMETTLPADSFASILIRN